METLIKYIVGSDPDDRENFESKLREYLCELRKQGRLEPSGLKGREVLYINAWDAFVRGADEKWHITLIANIINQWVFRLKNINRLTDEDKTRVLEKFLREGTIDPEYHYLSYGDTQDQVTGDRGLISFSDWKMEYWLAGARENNWKNTLATSVEKIQPVTVRFTAPCGHIMLTDTIRHDDFMNKINPPADEEYTTYSLNNVVGRQNLTKFHAEEQNFGYFQTTNTYVAVFRKDNHFIVTEMWEDGKDVRIRGWKKVGDFSCDIWRVTAIDKSVFAKITGHENTESLEQYLASGKSYSNNFAHMEVPAGSTIKMTSGKNLDSMMDKKSLGIPKRVYVWGHFEIED